MMAEEDREMEEDHLSISVPSQHELNISSSDVVRETDRYWGRMLSGVICMNILILGCALATASAHNEVNIKTSDLQIYLTIICFLATIWISYYAIFTARQENAVNQDAHAGAIWLRGGLVLFGILSSIMDIFKIASYVGNLHCDSTVKVVFPVVQLVFIVVQTYFLWFHAKDCVQLQKNLTLCGLMVTLATNLVVWVMAITEESLNRTTVPEYASNTTGPSRVSLFVSTASDGDEKCKCIHTSCNVFKEAYYYLYPFNIEYSLFASAIVYIMWKNVSRVTQEPAHHKIRFHLKDVFLGPIVGILLVVAGLATFIAYEMEMKKRTVGDDDKKDKAMLMHFVMNIVIVTMMSISTVIGCAIYKVDHREYVSEKNPTRSLDVRLLVGSSLGQFIISYFTIVAMIANGAKGYLNRLNLAWAVLMVIQLGLQNFFIIEGLHREAIREVRPVTVVLNPYVPQPSKEPSSLDESDLDKTPSQVSTENSLDGHTPKHRHKLSWKRWVLKEVCLFLLLGNIILWIMPAFGARPQFDHDTETDFYNFNMWTAVVNIGLPFGVFYRMHSFASLFEVFRNS